MDLDQAADELYAADLEDFVAERKRLAKELRDAGNAEEAQELAKLRKPTVPAWVLNQLARRNRREVDLLLHAGHRLREAQAGALRGTEKDAFEQARRTESDALRALAKEAGKLLAEERGGASASVLNQVAESLRAAAISEAGRELLARGRFTEPMRSEGFDVVSGLAGKPAARAAERAGATRDELREAQDALQEARAALREAQREAAAAERAAERLEAEAGKAREAADDAHGRAERAGEELEAAQARVRRLRRK
jgi:hypothetical protein